MGSVFLVLLFPLLILFLIIAIIVLTVKYIRVNAIVLSNKNFHKEAARRANELEHEDPVISCDYCGSKIDTSIHTNCPNCGGEYSKDPEWLKRHAVNTEWVQENSEDVSEEKIQLAKIKAKKIARLLFFAVFGLVLILATLVVLFFVALHFEETNKYQTDEPLNDSKYTTYRQQDYEIKGKDVIFNKHGLKITVLGFYEEENPYSQEYFGEDFSYLKVGYRVDNYSGKDLYVRFDYTGINGISPGGFRIFYSLFKNNRSVTFYESLGKVRNGIVKEMTISNLELFDSEDFRYEQEENIKVITDADYEYSEPVIQDPLLYDHNNIQIFLKKSEEEDKSIILYIMNRSDMDYFLKDSSFRIRQKEEDRPIYKEYLPAHHTFISDTIRIRSQEEIDYKNCDISVSLSCPEDPSLDFSTGYLPLE